MSDLDFSWQDESIDGAPTTPETLSSALASTALRHALSAEQRRMLAGNGGILLLVGVPTESWFEPIEKVTARQFGPFDAICAARPAKRHQTSDPRLPEVSARLARGEKVAVLAADVDAHVDAGIRAAADIEVTIDRVTAKDLRRAVRQTAGQHLTGLRDADLVGLGLDDLVAAVRAGGSQSAILHRIRRAHLRRTGSPDLRDVPMLNEIAGLGAVGDWARATVVTLDRARTGTRPLPIASALLVGPPGVGKTMIVRSIAKSSRVPFVETSVGRWLSNGDGALGDVVRAIDDMVARALELPVSVLFIDELDAVPDRKRLSQRGRDWWTPVVTHLLTQIDRIRRVRPGILIVAATNHGDRLDEALVRPGRFDQHIDVTAPDEAALREILVSLIGDELSSSEIAALAKLGAGATGATARTWVEAARRRAADASRGLAFRDILPEVAPEDRRSDEERQTVALHEAGHAVVAADLGIRVSRLSIRASPGASGETTISPSRLHALVDDVDGAMVAAMGGRAADELLGLGANIGATGDLERATAIAVGARAAAGLRGRLSHRGDPEAIPALLAQDGILAREVEGDLRRALERAREIVGRRRRDVLALAEKLLERRILDGAEIEALLEAGGMSAEYPPCALETN
jgi:hypothetical protein